MISSEAFQAALDAGDEAAIISLLRGATPDERRPLAPAALAAIARAARRFRPGEAVAPLPSGARKTATLAALGTCSMAQLLKVPRWTLDLRPHEAAGLVAVMSGRDAGFLSDLVHWYCRPAIGSWDLAAILVRNGLCARPETDDWIHGLYDAERGVLPRARSIREALDADPLVIERGEIWRIFEVEGVAERSLATVDRPGHAGGWTQALVALSSEGRLDRARLLDASLAALARDFTAFHAAWYSRFHEALKPTADERAERADAYLGLTGSAVPTTAKFAIEALAEVESRRPIDGARLIRAMRPALVASGKGTALLALRLIDGVALREAALQSAAARACADALTSKHADVQARSLDVIERHGDRRDAELVLLIEASSGSIAPRLRARAEGWIGQAPSVTECGAASPHVDALVGDPISSLDDLLLAAAATLEVPDDPMELERVLDGISRLCAERPSDFDRRAAPLGRRCRKLLDARAHLWEFPGLQRGLGQLLIAWIERDADVARTWDGKPHRPEWSVGAFLLVRMDEIARRAAASQAAPLLALPTWRSGFIEPCELVRRWKAREDAGVDPSLADSVAALLRLHPEGREEALGMAAQIRGEGGRALRLALGGPSDVGPSEALWLAAWRSREARGDLPTFESQHPALGPDAGRAAIVEWSARRWKAHGYSFFEVKVSVEPSVTAERRPHLVPVLTHESCVSSSSRSVSVRAPMLRWSFTTWPLQHEGMMGAIAPGILTRYAEVAGRELRPGVEILAHPHVGLGPMARLVLALALAAQLPDLQIPAQDALAAAITDGRLVPAELGETMARLLGTGEESLCRWEKSLRDVARLSPAHGRVVQALLERALAIPSDVAPRNVGKLLALLADLTAENGAPVSDAGCRAFLAGLARGGAAGNLAKQLAGEVPR